MSCTSTIIILMHGTTCVYTGAIPAFVNKWEPNPGMNWAPLMGMNNGEGGPCMLTYWSFRDTCPSISAVHHIKGEETQHTTLVHNGRCQFTTGQHQMPKIYSAVTGVCHQGVDTSTVGFFDEWMEEYFAIYLAYANGVTQKSSQYIVIIYLLHSLVTWTTCMQLVGFQLHKGSLQQYTITDGQKDRIESCSTQ